MKASRETLTPQMDRYADFVDRAETRWLPYLMYFHRTDYRSDVVNTDRFGFRLSYGPDGMAGSVEAPPAGPLRLLVGSSTAFGVGTTNDRATIASRLWTRYAPSGAWLNFGGRGYCSTQETLLFLLHRHLLPPVEEVVILSGLNNLALAGLPRSSQSEFGAFFFSGEYYQQMNELRKRHRRTTRSKWPGWRRRQPHTDPEPDTTLPDLADRISTAVERTIRDIERWRLLASATGARITFVLQPLATWVRTNPETREALLFAELDRHPSNFWKLFGAIAPMEVGRRYAAELGAWCQSRDVPFLDLNVKLAEVARDDRWLFVDRAHFNDDGYDLVSSLLAGGLDLK
ncbi:Inducer of phenazine A [Micromonospora sp. NPDC048999]|uniref:Inducer of phenazine A n=1 Tax=Micromonospora sp. NPDC048999 TaxID=3155391 RepID=UPI0033D1D3DB